MKFNATEGRAKVFDRDFPNLIGETPVLAQPIPANGLSLDGVPLVPVDLGHTDTDETTVLHVPSLGLVVAGDVVYNGVHQYLVESGNGGINTWLAALDQLEALRPEIVVAGHKNRALPNPKIIGETRRYLRDAKRLLAERPTPQAYYEQMLQLYPDRLNRGPLWYSGFALLTLTTVGELSPRAPTAPRIAPCHRERALGLQPLRKHGPRRPPHASRHVARHPRWSSRDT